MQRTALPTKIKSFSSNKLNPFKTTLGICLMLIFSHACAASSNYLIGSGIEDITGPAAEVGMMGYAELSQKTNGLRMRQFARAFVVVDHSSGKRIAFVTADLGQLFQSVKQGVIAKLKHRGYSDKYFDENVMLSATHNHSGPGGYAHFALFNLSTFGFNPDNYNNIVDGITNAIIRADSTLAEGKIFYNEGKLYQASKNRSVTAFYANPADERDEFNGEETDKTMRLLRFNQDAGHEIGMINWFADHGVSMSKHNRLITGDNKGYASYLFEKSKNSNYKAKYSFVAAYAQSSEGDVSPNIFAFGNGIHDAQRVEVIGQKHYDKARELYDNASKAVTGKVDYRLHYVNLSNYNITPEFANGKQQHTCPSALGVSFTKGTSDGSGLVIDKALLKATGSVLTSPTSEDIDCHAPKEIFLATAHFKPYPWLPDIVPLQIFQLGSVAIVGVPGEFTTVAGEELRETVISALGDTVETVIISGLSNSYTGYVTTREEYLQQQYEGGFTIYGPWTLNAYQQEFHQLATELRNGQDTAHGPNPPDLSKNQTNMQTGVVYDNIPLGIKFGQVISKRDAKAEYKRGETVDVSFWGGHPKNNFHKSVKNHHESFLYVQRWQQVKWVNVYNDNDWNTIYHWLRHGIDASHIKISWLIPKDEQPGRYRILHQGYYKNGFTRKIYPYHGVSRTFTIKQ